MKIKNPGLAVLLVIKLLEMTYSQTHSSPSQDQAHIAGREAHTASKWLGSRCSEHTGLLLP